MEVKRRSQRIAEKKGDVEEVKRIFIEGIVAQLDYKRKYGGPEHLYARLPKICCDVEVFTPKDFADLLEEQGFDFKTCQLDYAKGVASAELKWPYPLPEDEGRQSIFWVMFVRLCFLVFTVVFMQFVYRAIPKMGDHDYESECYRTAILLGLIMFYTNIIDKQYRVGNKFRKFSMKV